MNEYIAAFIAHHKAWGDYFCASNADTREALINARIRHQNAWDTLCA